MPEMPRVIVAIVKAMISTTTATAGQHVSSLFSPNDLAALGKLRSDSDLFKRISRAHTLIQDAHNYVKAHMSWAIASDTSRILSQVEIQAISGAVRFLRLQIHV